MPEDKTPEPEQPEEKEVAVEEVADAAETAEAAVEEAAETSEEVAEDTGETPEEAAAETAEEAVIRLQVEVAALNDKILRSLAEGENVRRRAAREREDGRKYAVRGLAHDLLSVADNLGRTLSSIDAHARAADPHLDTLFVGVEMVQRDMLAVFERHGIKAMEALGDKFDPMKHEAMFEIEDETAAAGTVAQVLETGYTLHERTLRAAKVGIVKATAEKSPPEKPAPETPGDA
jgi:molecular chaperone GrpE